MNSVELHPAYLWVCDSCGKENVFVSEKLDTELIEYIDEEERWELEEAGEGEDSESILEITGENGEEPLYYREYSAVFACPSTVICKYCKTEFEAVFE